MSAAADVHTLDLGRAPDCRDERSDPLAHGRAPGCGDERSDSLARGFFDHHCIRLSDLLESSR
jgi:hypothetical protein